MVFGKPTAIAVGASTQEMMPIREFFLLQIQVSRKNRNVPLLSQF
jgi:hypothetical protein